MDKYRLLAHKDEIIAMVQKAPVLELGNIWQTLPNKRELYSIRKIEIIDEAFVFHSLANFEFDLESPIFIKINYRNLIFKLMPGEFRYKGSQLLCLFPREAKAIEARGAERTKLPVSSKINVTLKSLDSSTAIDVVVQLNNISESGIGARTSILNIEFFRKSNLYKIISVCGRPHIEEGTLTLRHITEKKEKKLIELGFQSDKHLSDELFSLLREGILRLSKR